MRRIYLIFICLFVTVGVINAQRVLTGTVSDPGNSPLPGVTVVVKGTTIGTVTGPNGSFSLSVPDDSQTLVFSFIGMKSQEVAITGTQYNIVLEPDIVGLDEVIAIGYGTERRGSITGAISSVSARDIQEMPVMDAGSALQGRAAGLVAMSAGNRPGEGVTIRIRGRRSLTASNDPLYVVDDVPYEGNINDINPSDIKSMEILKDASATAIYGARGANGVILITTHRGGNHPTTVSYQGYYGITSPYGYPDYMTSEQYAQLRIDGGRTLTSDEQAALDRGVNTDWLKLLITNGYRTNHQISVKGGDARTAFNFSAGIFQEQGVSSTQDFTRKTLRLNLDHRVSDRFKVGNSLQISDQFENLGENFWGAGSLSPLAEPYYPDGSIWLRPGNDPLLWNPLTSLEPNVNLDERTRLRVFGNLYIDLEIAKGLSYRMNFGPDFQESNLGQFRGKLSSARQGGSPEARKEETKTYTYTLENIINYTKEFNQDNVLRFTGLYSFQEYKRQMTNLQVRDLPYEHQLYHNLGTGETVMNYGSSLSEWGIMSYMGRINYDFMGKYLFTLTARYDGSSVLSEQNKWGFFPSGAFLWRISEEGFMANQSLLSDLRMRVSYGVTGNSAILPYQTRGNLSRSVYSFGDAAAWGYRPGSIANPDLRWESSATANIGFDFGVKNIVAGSLNLYQTNTTDLLLQRNLPITSGFNNIMQNIGETRNRGWELTLSGSIIDKNDFKWDANVNLFGNKEEIVELYGTGENDRGNQWFIGHPISVWYDYEKIGIWQLGEEADAAKYQAKPGLIKIKDQNGDFLINQDDMVILGTDMPKVNVGFNSRMAYKNFDLSVFVFGVFGHMVYNTYEEANLQGRYNHQMVDYWTPTNPSNTHPMPDGGREYPLYSSSRAYMKGDFVKIKNIQLGYTLPRGALSFVGVEKLRAYANVDTPIIFSSLHKSLDPEIRPKTGANDDQGGRITTREPTLRMISFGLSVDF